MSGKNFCYGITGLLAVILGFAGKTVYRDFITANNINDLGTAGFLPSFFYVTGFSLLLLMRETKYPSLIIVVVTSASLLFELKQMGSAGSFDFRDAVASIIGGLAALLIMKLIEKKG